MAENLHQAVGSTTPADVLFSAASLDGRLRKEKQRRCLPVFNLLSLLLLFLSCSSGFALPFLEVNFDLRIDGDIVPRALMFAASGLGVFYVIIHVCGSRTHFTITQHGPPWLYGNHLHTFALLLTRLGAAVWIAAIVMLSLVVARLGIRLRAPLAVQSVYLDLIVSGVAFLSLVAVIVCIELSKTPFKTSILSRRSFLRGRSDEKGKDEDGEFSVSRRASLIRAENAAQPMTVQKRRTQPSYGDQPRELLNNNDDDEYDLVSGSSDRPLRSPTSQGPRLSPEERTATPPSFMTSQPRSGPRPASPPRPMPYDQEQLIINPQTGRAVTYFDVRREPTLPVLASPARPVTYVDVNRGPKIPALLSPARPVTYFEVPKRPASSYIPYRPESARFEPPSFVDMSFRSTASFDPLAEPTENFEPAKRIEHPKPAHQAPFPPLATDRPRMPPPVAMTRYTLIPPPQRPVSAEIIKRKPIAPQSRMSTASAQMPTSVPPPPMPQVPAPQETVSPRANANARPAIQGILRSQNLAERAKARHAARSRAAVAQRGGPSVPGPNPLAPEPVQGFKTIPAPAWVQRPQSTVASRAVSPSGNRGSPFQDPGNPFQEPIAPSQPPVVPNRTGSRRSIVSLTSSSRPATEHTASTRSATTAPSTTVTTPSATPPPSNSRSPSPKSNYTTTVNRANTASATHTRGLSRTQLRMRKENMNHAVHHRAASSVNNFSRPLRATDGAAGEQGVEAHNRSRSDAAESATSGSGGSMVVQRGDTPPLQEAGNGRGRVVMAGAGRDSRVEKKNEQQGGELGG